MHYANLNRSHGLIWNIFLLVFFRWVCIYPAYLNSKKSRQEGRKIRKDLCVENPTYQEIKDVLSVSNLRIGIENKLYSRERSKVRVLRAQILRNQHNNRLFHAFQRN